MSLFNKVNLKQFETIQYIVDNSDTEHITCIIKCALQTDKPETPYYMDTDIAITHCTGLYNKGIVHAMDVFKHDRMYNLTEDAFNKLDSIMRNTFEEVDDRTINVTKTDKQFSIEIQTTNKAKLNQILKTYSEFFNEIDKLA